MHAPSSRSPLLILATLGVVYGDIGTSPLYALKTCFKLYNLPVTAPAILGIISLIFWTLILIVSFKYIHLILRADNHGEGGILSLFTLVSSHINPRLSSVVLFLGMLGTALFYGDGMITPAISVLSAIEGLSIISPHYTAYVLNISLLILIGLFLLQKRGSQKIGMIFGPIMVLWFIVLGLLGFHQILQTPSILLALDPRHGFSFLLHYGPHTWLVFGAIVLVVTGAEALYADLGHFNVRAIKISWHFLVLPALALNYLGQGALLLNQPEAINNPFYHLAPTWALLPLVLLATCATIIASQAIISGIFSISWQAIQLGYLPRMRVIHTSAQHIGQVYLPTVNFLLLGGTLLAALLFRSSDALASAYGVTITWIMLITSLLALLLASSLWKWSILHRLVVFTPLLMLDGLFWISSMNKLTTGGWFPLLIAASMYLLISTWTRGRAVLTAQSTEPENLADYLNRITLQNRDRIPGTAVFMCRSNEKVPATLRMHLDHNKFLHETVLFLSIVTEPISRVQALKRLEIAQITEHIYRISAHFGFMEVPHFPHIMQAIQAQGIDIKTEDLTFFFSRGLPIASTRPELRPWQELIFIFLSHNALNAADFYQVPDEQVVEYGVRFKI